MNFAHSICHCQHCLDSHMMVQWICLADILVHRVLLGETATSFICALWSTLNLVAQKACRASKVVCDGLDWVHLLGVMCGQCSKFKHQIAVSDHWTPTALRPLCETGWLLDTVPSISFTVWLYPHCLRGNGRNWLSHCSHCKWSVSAVYARHFTMWYFCQQKIQQWRVNKQKCLWSVVLWCLKHVFVLSTMLRSCKQPTTVWRGVMKLSWGTHSSVTTWLSVPMRTSGKGVQFQVPRYAHRHRPPVELELSKFLLILTQHF